MKVLWLCNMMLPMIAQHFQMEASNKEGWLSGLAEVMLTRQAENGIRLAIAFPVGEALLPAGEEVFEKELLLNGVNVQCFGFREDTVNPHVYDDGLEERMRRIVSGLQPDVVHCFGTEYPHTLAMCRVFPDKSKLLITIQGLCSVCADIYEADLPERVVRHATFRDILKKDDIQRQKAKYEARGRAEIEAIRLAGNIGGRTEWDRYYAKEWHPEARYFEMRETLRSYFYEGRWSAAACEPHSIFLSQGDYPIKGLHYMLLAMPKILKHYPDTRVYVAGNSVTAYMTWKDKIKISAYGAYLRSLMKEYQLEDKVIFLGKLSGEQMKAQYLKSSLFVCCSAIENSPNSLGEAMLLGMPCVSADVGGIPSIFTAGVDGVGYAGTKSRKNSFDREVYEGEDALFRIADNLSRAVLKMWQDSEQEAVYCENARQHALRNHDRQSNYEKTVKTYAEIAGVGAESMKFVFVSNYLNHHQIPFCRAMERLMEGSFAFIQTQPVEEERLRMGWSGEVDEPYLLMYEKDPEGCQKLIDEAQILMFGGTDDERYIQTRLRSGKLILRNMERLYKTGQWKAVSPRGLRRKYLDHTRYRNAPVYMLCAGAYVPSDLHIVRAYPGKMFCWGYFPEAKTYDVAKLLAGKGYRNDKGERLPYLLWSGRMIDWKHPELVLETAKYLKEKGLQFHIDMIGGGAMEAEIKAMAKNYGLRESVSFPGFLPPEKVREYMEKADIYLLVSDRQEGWGAVANESMNSACALVADHMVGAAPYLIRHGVNGLVYRDGDRSSLFQQVEALVKDLDRCRLLGENAYETIHSEWNAQRAAERLCALIDRIQGTQGDGEGAYFECTQGKRKESPEGSLHEPGQNIGPIRGIESGQGFVPCQSAPVISERAMYRYLTKF